MRRSSASKVLRENCAGSPSVGADSMYAVRHVSVSLMPWRDAQCEMGHLDAACRHAGVPGDKRDLRRLTSQRPRGDGVPGLVEGQQAPGCRS